MTDEWPFPSRKGIHRADNYAFTTQAIEGPLKQLSRLGALVRDLLKSAKPGDRLEIDSQYSEINEAVLVLDVRADDFDPGSEDHCKDRIWSGG